jgi:hypothetical protein
MPITDPRHVEWATEFESMGEESVRMMDPGPQAIASDKIRYSRAWLTTKESDRRDKREEKTLSVARRANVIATVALITSVLALFFK